VPLQNRSILPHRHIEDISRRGLLVAPLAAALFAACRSDDDTRDRGAPAATTRMFTDSTGQTVEIPVRPQRVVALHDSNGGAQALSLGAPVVGLAHLWPPDKPPGYIARHFDLSTTEGIGWWTEISVEKVASLRPDLIIAYADDEGGIHPPPAAKAESAARLRAIAPMVAINTFRPVEAVMADFAALLGVEQAVLDRQRAEFEAALEEVATALNRRWSEVTVAYMHARADSIDAWGPRRLPVCDIVTRAGAAWFPLGLTADAAPAGRIAQISLERMHEFECDLLLYSNNVADLRDNPLFQRLGAVRAGQVIPMPDPFFGAHYPNYIAAAKYIAERVRAMKNFNVGIV
jgi:ABC-type Fe3+-hydroxamate transport system substrate-binding protein